MQFGVSEAVEYWGKYRPENIAVYYNNKSLSYKSLNHKVDQFANYLLTMQIEDERIGIAINTKINFLICLLAILKLGKSVVTLNVGLPSESLQLNVEDTKVNYIVVEAGTKTKFKREGLKLIDFGLAKMDEIFHIVKISLRQPTDEWGVLFSSGTTGIPKGVERDHNSIITELLGWCLELGLNRRSSFYIGRPIFYTGG